jgi:hypothetical protein
MLPLAIVNKNASHGKANLDSDRQS